MTDRCFATEDAAALGDGCNVRTSAWFAAVGCIELDAVAGLEKQTLARVFAPQGGSEPFARARCDRPRMHDVGDDLIRRGRHDVVSPRPARLRGRGDGVLVCPPIVATSSRSIARSAVPRRSVVSVASNPRLR